MGSSQTAAYCYVHAAEEGLLDLPLATLRTISDRLGYSVNALAFTLDAVLLEGVIETAAACCAAVVKGARAAFGGSAQQALTDWKITKRRDVGTILTAALEAGLVKSVAGYREADFEDDVDLWGSL